jgi:ABC-type transporter Mla subunit MlaD
MRLPVPGPRDVLDQLEGLVGLLPRAFGMLDRVDALLTRIEQVTTDAALVVRRVDGVVDTVQPLTTRLQTLLDGLEPSLTALQPTLERLADTTDPDEVAALVAMIDHLPELTRRLEDDILPIMGTLGSVAPDLHDLLTVSRELNDMMAKLPGFGRIKRRIDEQQGDDGTDAEVRD